jgi:hypothetical protein
MVMLLVTIQMKVIIRETDLAGGKEWPATGRGSRARVRERGKGMDALGVLSSEDGGSMEGGKDEKEGLWGGGS